MEQQTYREQFELEDEHWWFKGRRAVIWSLLARTTNGARLRVLDAGCGTGRNIVEFGVLGTAEGIDFSAEAVEFCRRRGIERVRVGDLESLPYGDGEFDLILATDVIEHLRDDAAALRELRRVVAPGGHLLITVPAYTWLWSEHDEAHHHFRRYTLRRLRSRVGAAGWTPLVWTYFNTTLLPPIAAVRLAGRARRARNAAAPSASAGGVESDVQPTAAPLNRLLEAPMRAEAALIRRGVRLPAGVSIGMVCAA